MTNVNFLKSQLEKARLRKPELDGKLTVAIEATLGCNGNDDCTVAQKEILVLTSNNAAAVQIKNDTDIKKYIEDIAEQEGVYATKSGAFTILEEGAKEDI